MYQLAKALKRATSTGMVLGFWRLQGQTSMIKSMTGFASLTHEDERATIGVTIRAVNHRFLDIQLRIPQSLADLEPRVRALLQKRLARGRVELAISRAAAHRGRCPPSS